jgi:hypothetical protein
MSIESSGDQDSGERKIGPTVTKDRWINHARSKLAKGYVLIVSTSRKNANFYSPTKGYEMCAYDVAKKLIADGTIIRTRAHHLGEVYELSGPLPQITPARKKRVIDDDEPEFIEVLDGVDSSDDDDQLDDDGDDEEATVDEFDDEEEEEDEDDFEDEEELP